MDEKIQQVVGMIENIVSDTAIPKNIRKALTDASEGLKTDEELNVKVSAAVYLIESVSDDINMPAHARTQLWAVISSLESLKAG